MKKNRIILRADGNTSIGYGHVMRLLSFASMLKKKYSCVFIIQQPDDFVKKQILSVCDSILEIPILSLHKEKQQLSKVLKPTDIFILDGYRFDTPYQAAIKKNCFKLVCIDDLHDKHFLADAVINHGEGIDKKNYSAASYTQLYLGVKYAILRKSFLNNLPVVKLPPRNGVRVFINMGGTDEHNYSLKALKICLKNVSVTAVDIVIGNFYKYTEQLEKLIRSNKHISTTLHRNLQEKSMCKLMKKSHVAICSASTVSYEYASVGAVLFIYKTVNNQKNIYSFLISSAIAFKAKQFDSKLKELQQAQRFKDYLKNKSSYFTGQSDKNLLTIFEKFENERSITMRKATADDLIIYHQWANEKEVRKNSFNQASIPLMNHTKWFHNKLKSKETTLYFFEKKGIPLGQVRFDIENAGAEIDYSVDSKFRGAGYGEILLAKAIADYSRIHPQTLIIGKVKDTNIASKRVFIKMGFKFRKTATRNGGYITFTILPASENAVKNS